MSEPTSKIGSRFSIPELKALDRSRNLVRIPPETNVPVTPRILRLIESAPFQRLGRISQLGLVSKVYPGATHTRLEHSLGVYRLGLYFLRSLQQDQRFCELVDDRSASLFIATALLHDLGHWPFCHPIEDMKLSQVQHHESFAREQIVQSCIGALLERDWDLDAEMVAGLLCPLKGAAVKKTILHSMLSGPIDIDKMDYLDRDSLHAGVPYGRNFDQQRLINALCVGPSGAELAITEKGRTAAEMMVFARYVMFSEVYWHHTVRSATAMLQRAVYALRDLPGWMEQWHQQSEQQWIDGLVAASRQTPIEPLVDGLFGANRRLYKRLAQFHCQNEPELHRALARRPYPELVRCSELFAEQLSSLLGVKVANEAVLIDAPPVKLEVQFQVPVMLENGEFRPLSDLSPVVQTLATQQFDDVVKRVRVFVAPELRESVPPGMVQKLLGRAIEQL